MVMGERGSGVYRTVLNGAVPALISFCPAAVGEEIGPLSSNALLQKENTSSLPLQH